MNSSYHFDCCDLARERHAPFPPGTILHGRYAVQRLITRTDLNNIYLTQDQRTKTATVLKHAHCAGRRRDTGCAQYAILAHEYLMLQLLTDRGLPVPHPIELFFLAGRPCFAMRYVVGATIEDCRRQRRLPDRLVVQAIARTATVVHRIHQQGYVVHDLKPGNIMLTPGGVVLLDLGAAHSITPPSIRSAVVFGTPSFMSPQQERGEAIPRNDVYALGMCLDVLISRPSPLLNRIIRRAVNPLPPFTNRADLLALQLHLLLALDTWTQILTTRAVTGWP